MTRERMSPVDVAWLRMDRPTNPMVIVGVMLFDAPVDFKRLKRVIARRFACFSRFRARPLDEIGGAWWVEDPGFNLDAHVLRAALPAPAGPAELQALVAGLTCTDLDPGRPLWEFHLIENYATGAAVVMRIHHCYADGIALMDVFMGMTDPAPGTPSARRPTATAPPSASPLAWIGELPVPGAALVERALEQGGHWLSRLAELALHPQQANELAQHGVGLVGEAIRVAMLPADPKSPLKGRLGRRKQVAWSERLPLVEVATVARAHGCTVNDVIMSTAAGAIGSYLRARGRIRADLVLRAAVPVNLRHADRPPSLGNAFGLVFLDLPVGIVDPLLRLAAVHEAMQRLKQSYQPLLMLGLLGALGLMPGRVEGAAIDLLSAKSSLVASNVPGPRQPVYLAGRRISELLFWVPQSGQLGAGISLLSYDGAVQFGLYADARRIPDPQALVTRFPAEFEKLVLATLLGPLLRGA